jgi:2-polyprenyl-3-methyl-5-hydroxy-6-metoxy-1,4-benzoquinol methylase
MTIANGAYPYVEKKQPWSSHWFIRQFMAGFKPGTRVLDIGAASGILGQSLAGSGFVLTGLEPDSNWAGRARPYYQHFWQGTVEAAPQELLANHDVVILGDILEHLSNPESVMERLTGLQPGGCVFIVSVPNIANLYIRINLLIGRFEYQDRGILDRTHLRLFTRKTILKLLKSFNLEILDTRVTPVPLALINPVFDNPVVGHPLYKGLYYMTKLAPTLLGYQFVIKTQKPVR